MINKKDMTIMYLFIFLEILLLINSKAIADNIIYTSKIFILLIFPYLFPNMVISNILSEYPVYKIIPKIIRKHLKISDHIINIYILSLICGAPTNATIIKKYLDNGLVNEKEAESLLCTTHFINPLFVIGNVGIVIFKSLKIGITLYMLQILSNIIKYLILKKNYDNRFITIKKEKINTYNQIIESIKKSINNILMIFGIIMVFSILQYLICNILTLNNNTSTIIKCLLEITSGLQNLRTLNINIHIKVFLAYYTLSNGGICIWMQTIGIMGDKKKISYLKYLIFRVF